MKRIILLISAIIMLASCAKQSFDVYPMMGDYPDCSFAVISDIHYYDRILGDTGKVFQDYIDNDRKLLSESKMILDNALAIVKDNNTDFILIPGDLTKDGEETNHLILKDVLSYLDNVYVIPGNHDIDNPHAFSFEENKRIPSVSPDYFADIYGNMGYMQALSRDSASLSYIAEPVEGLILIALDCCKYDNNDEYPETSGAIKNATLQWMINELNHHSDKAAICMLHHPVTEHFNGMKKHYPEYVLDNNDALTDVLSAFDVKLIFTGHFHANDITAAEKSGNIIYDIETGSIVTYPSPFRIVTIKNSKAHIHTYHVKSIGTVSDFTQYSREYIRGGIMHIAEKRLKSFGVNDRDICNLTNLIADAFVAHYQGDEKSFNIIDYSKLSIKGKIIAFYQRGLVENLVNDKFPADNNVELDLSRTLK